MAWRIELPATAARQLAKLPKGEARRITAFLRHRVAAPEDTLSVGKALTGPKSGTCWRLGVDDYRLVCDIQDGALCVLVIEVGNHPGC